MRAWALIPVKDFAQAKSRLRPVLAADECAALAECMVRDVLSAVVAAPSVEKVNLLGQAGQTAALARPFGCVELAERPGMDLNDSLAAAVAGLIRAGAKCLLILPGDLPMLSSQDVEALLAYHAGGLTVCAAQRDGGTNALVVTPPDAIPFHFGQDSAKRHLAAGQRAGLERRTFTLPAFGRDIDTPADLLWLSRSANAGCTGAYLDESGIARRLSTAAKSALA